MGTVCAFGQPVSGRSDEHRTLPSGHTPSLLHWQRPLYADEGERRLNAGSGMLACVLSLHALLACTLHASTFVSAWCDASVEHSLSTPLERGPYQARGSADACMHPVRLPQIPEPHHHSVGSHACARAGRADRYKLPYLHVLRVPPLRVQGRMHPCLLTPCWRPRAIQAI